MMAVPCERCVSGPTTVAWGTPRGVAPLPRNTVYSAASLSTARFALLGRRVEVNLPPLSARSTGRRSCITFAAEGWTPATVADTKMKFYQGYRKPIPPIYNTVIQELLVQQHLIRYNRKYSYDQVFGLGFVSTFEQVLDGLPEAERTAIFDVYIRALDEDPSRYRADAERLESWAKGLAAPEELKPKEDGDDVQRDLASIAARAKEGKFLYSKFFAIGLFRLLEVTGAKDPKALEALVTALGAPAAGVNRDLMTYKSILSKLAAAKELMREMFEREKRKAAEREAEKAKGSDAQPEPSEKKEEVLS